MNDEEVVELLEGIDYRTAPRKIDYIVTASS
jgi:hypothetical protein